MMTSHAEAFRLCQRVLFALGFPAGADEDAAFALCAISNLGFAGLEKLHESVPQMRERPYAHVVADRRADGALHVNAAEDAGFYAPSEIIDLACVHASRNPGENLTVHLSSLRFLQLLPAVAMIRSANEHVFEFRLGASRARVHKGNLWLSRELESLGRDFGSDATVRCRLADAPESCALRSEDMNEVGKTAMGRRIHVDSHAWRGLKRVATEAFVPASAMSRSRGAGAEIDDND